MSTLRETLAELEEAAEEAATYDEAGFDSLIAKIDEVMPIISQSIRAYTDIYRERFVADCRHLKRMHPHAQTDAKFAREEFISTAKHLAEGIKLHLSSF